MEREIALKLIDLLIDSVKAEAEGLMERYGSADDSANEMFRMIMDEHPKLNAVYYELEDMAYPELKEIYWGQVSNEED